ncbi:MAG: hypothetical protein WKF70_11845 [Chitinophagaceae bacterium]
MVSIVPNRSSIEGVVCSIQPNLDLKGYIVLELALSCSVNVEDYFNLAKADEGSIIRINVKADHLDSQLKPGDTFSGDIRKAPGHVYFLQET